LNVPRGVDSLRIDVLDTPGDVDLLLSQGEAAPTRDAYTAIADTYLGRESLLVEGTDRNGVTGEYYLSVLEASESDYPVSVRLVATYGSDVPESAPAVPVLAGAEYGADSVRLATVQLISPSGIGSGCIVSGDGKILTNHHVVVDDGGVDLRELIVAVAPAAFEVPVETYSAEVIRTSPKDDLALLQITGDRWGRPLPAGYRFPFWRLGDPNLMELGDPLLLMGYPWMGSGLSRSYFTLTRGILSGGERTSDGLIYKSDAVISGGSSGGAVSDESWRLLGLPSFVVSDEAAQLTYFVPVTRIPRDWRRLFGYE
ncbi:MAG: serine protease, partial [Spirochaetaceae bacterium]|nr:serine protease [Spirochaetaceae bacterium]